jgi:hypothetical protein
MSSALEHEFEREMRRINEEAKSVAPDYPGHIFDAMIDKHGGVGTATRLVQTGDIQAGFKKMARIHRLDLTCEELVVSKRFRSLFDQSIVDAAQWRLDQARRSP